MNQCVRSGSGLKRSFVVGGVAMLGLIAFACGGSDSPPPGGTAGQPGAGAGGKGSGTAGNSGSSGGVAHGGSGPATGGSGPVGGSSPIGGSGPSGGSAPVGGSAPIGGSGGSAGSVQAGSGGAQGGSAGSVQAGSGGAQGGSAGSLQAGSGGAQGGSPATAGSGGSGGSAGSVQTGGSGPSGGSGGTGPSGGSGGTGPSGGSGGTAPSGGSGPGTAGSSSGGGGGGPAYLHWNNGYIEGTTNIGGVRGYWHTYHDSGTSTIYQLPSFSSAGSSICVYGNVGQQSADNWGSVVAFNTNQIAGTSTAANAWNATTNGVNGFRFILSGTQVPATVQVNVKVHGLPDTTTYCSKFTGVSADNAKTVTFGSVTLSCFNGGSGTAVDATQIEAIQFQIPSSASGVTPFDFCVSSIQLLSN